MSKIKTQRTRNIEDVDITFRIEENDSHFYITLGIDGSEMTHMIIKPMIDLRGNARKIPGTVTARMNDLYDKVTNDPDMFNTERMFGCSPEILSTRGRWIKDKFPDINLLDVIYFHNKLVNERDHIDTDGVRDCVHYIDMFSATLGEVSHYARKNAARVAGEVMVRIAYEEAKND